MEEAWHAKCSSGWPVPPAVPVFPPLAVGSCNQINVNGQQFYHPDVMQSINLGNSQLFQEPLLPRIFNKDLRKSGNSETGNSFLSLLSGRSYNLYGELLPPLNSSSELPKLPVSDRDSFRQSSTCSFSSNFICNDALFNGELPSFAASRPLAADLSKELNSLVPHSDILDFSKAVFRNSSEDIARGIGVSSRRLRQNNQASQNLPPAANVHDIVSPLPFRDHPRVLCLNTAGELFVDDMGFLGVLCLCHCLPMSVAKFCQHSGLSSTFPCDIIRMENGMTLAQWCKMCFGNLTLGDCRGPDSISSKASSFSSLSKNHRTINSVKAYSELGRSEEFNDDSLYACCPNLAGKASMEKPVINVMDYENEKRNSGGNGLLHLTGFTQGATPITPENSNLQFVRESPEFLKTQRLHSIPNRREPNATSEVSASNVNIETRSRNTSAPHAPTGPKNNFIHGKNINTRGSSSNDAFVVDRNGSDLRLGQPSQDTHSSLSFFPTSINLSLPPVCFSPELLQQNRLSDRTDFARETMRAARLNRPSPLPETSCSVRRTPHSESRTTFSFHNSESEDLTKDSSISLFLSHLTGGTGLSNCSNRSLDAKSTVVSSINCDLLSSRENLSRCTRNEIDKLGKASSFDEIDYFNSNGKIPCGVTDSSRNVENTDVRSKEIEDGRVNQPSINGQSFHSCPAKMGKSSLFSNQPFRSLQKGTDSKNSNTNGKMANLKDGYHLSSIIVRGSEILATQCDGSPSCLESESPITRSSTNSNHISETNCSCKENVKFPDHLMDGNSRFLASLRHESLMSKQEQVSFKRKSQHRKFCCLSAMESHKNSCTDDLAGQKNGIYFNIHQNESGLHSGSNCYYNNPFGALHCESASYKCCNCAASGQRTSPCSTFSSHHICGTKRHLCFRPREISSDASLDNEYDMCIYKRGGHPVCGNCCCATFSKCMAGCSLNGALNNPDIMNDQNVNGMLKHMNPPFEKCATFQSGRTIELEQSTCFKKIVSTQNNNKTGFWRDASSKIIGYSAAIPENCAETSEAACKELDGTFIASMSLDAQQVLDRSKSSAPAITEVSVEVNKRDSQISNVNTGMILHYSLFDEGSGIEKCCSSDEGPNIKKCEVVDTSGMSSLSCDNIVSEFKFSASSKKNGVRNKITAECTEQENSQRHHLSRVCILRKRKEPCNNDEYNDAIPDSDFFLAHLEPPESIDEVKCLHPLSKRVEISMEPDNAVEGTCIISGGSSNLKQKRSDFPSSKFVSLKKLEDRISRPEESKNSVVVVEKHGKQNPVKRLNHLHGKRPPKYMLLSSIVDSRNHESENFTISRRPIVCENSGIISSGEVNALQKSPKIVPLDIILEKARRCRPNSEAEPKTSLILEMECTGVNDQNCRELSSCKSPNGSGNSYLGRSKVGSNKRFMSGRESHLSKLDSRKGIQDAWYAEIRSKNLSMNSKAATSDQWKMHRKRNSRSELSSVGAALCCVCGSSNKETTNCLLECNRCLIRVHQACYGISEVPKDVWYCRPCKRSSHNIELLQREFDEVDHQNIGLYENCMLHARSDYHIDSPPMNVEAPSSIIKEWSCARVEGFKGRGKGSFPNYQNPFNNGDGCIVSQVQINAWVHINGQKSCIRGGVEQTCSDVEHDLRKEYIRYKLSKGWKHLVVYNSGIHDLGLYTSRFITRGAMVVEYVGEVVGLRVADNREIEYQTGRRLQCKSACYFFRIDKEHIIDATRKGGIARFVNHSCLPNCVAKVISIKNEKKVVFFAERDINPGEEVTYDYHFNREDEGKKIPCFCNSKNCRRFLN